MSSKIRIEIFAGLCNRMRVLDAAIQLAKRNNSQLDVIWNLERKFNCKLEELFLVPEYINTLVCRDLHTIPRKIARRLDYFHNIKSDNCFYNKEVYRLMRKNTDFEKLTKDKTTFISTDKDFFAHSPGFNEFTVVEPLMQKIASYTDHFDQIIGVHIRRTDHKRAKKYSPTSLFIKYMERELTEHPESRFFLATDSPKVENRMVEVFGNKIITHSKRSLNRNNPDAIKDALIDLYCLGNCKKIIGSYWSSFTVAASELSGAETIIVKSAT